MLSGEHLTKNVALLSIYGLHYELLYPSNL